MKALQFVTTYLPAARITEQKTGILATVILAQSALETGWGDHAPGFMMFGVKDVDGINGNEQLVTTFEYSKRGDLTPKQIGLHNIASVKSVMLNGVSYFKYTGQAYFRKYNTPEESFTDHARIFLTVKRYSEAMKYKSDPEKFVRLMAPIYAQSPIYADTVLSIMKNIDSIIKKNGLA